MEEDVLGPREELVGDRYTRCTRCGEVIPKEEAILTLVEGVTEATDELELCRECRRELESGEVDLAAEEIEEGR